MDKKTFSIGIMTVTAVLLFVANFIVPARATETVKDRDWQMITGRVQSGGDALYLVDNRTGAMLCFVYDPTAKSLKLAAQPRPVADAFGR